MSDFKDIFGDWRPEEFRNSEGFRSTPEGSPTESEPRPQRALNEKEVKVVNVYEGVYETSGGNSPTHSTTFVLLRDNKGREFRVFVLRDMAYAISMAIENAAPDRPFTHDLIKILIEKLGGKVDRVTIDDLWQDTFYAKVSVLQGEETMDIDSRPSDAIAMALRFRAPIYVAEWIIEAAQQE